LIGLAITISSSKAHKDAENFLYDLGFEKAGRIRRNDLIAHAEACIKAKAEIEEFSGKIGALELSNTNKNDSLRKIIATAKEALARFGIECEGVNISELLADTAERFSAVANRGETLEADIEKYSASVNDTRAKLEGEDEASLRAHLTPAAKEMLDQANPIALKQDRDEYAARLDAARTRLLDSEKHLGIIEGTCENPNRLAAELEASETALAEAEAKHAAIVLAYESIQGAGESLRRNVTPRLRSNAGALMRHLTGGKYYDFGISEDFSLSILTDCGTKPISSLSAGTRDAAYFSLRTALSSMLFPADRPPMILDEVFAQLDDTRAENLLDLLSKIANESQIIILTCHSREAELLRQSEKDFSLITL
jgi:uncharacterized protein YhaN